MSNINEVADFATFYRMYKQLESENQRLEGIQPQHPTTQAHRPPTQRLSPAWLRPQPYQQTPLRNASEFTTFFRTFNELKKRLDDIYAALNNLRDMSEQIKLTVEENMAIMNGNMERFEVIGRGILNMALHPLNSQAPNGSSSQPQTSSNPPPLSQHASQQQTSNPQKPYGQGPNVTQPSMAFGPSQAPESDTNYFDYSALEFLAPDAS